MQLINVIKFLHSCKPAVIYRDLKPENIMIDKFYNVKLTDFGLKMTGTTGTIRYMAPEVYFGQYYDLSADVYSLGLIIYYVFSGSRPFLDYNTQTIGTYFTNPDLLFSTKLVKDRRVRSTKCSIVETLAPLSFDIVVQKTALLTLKIFGIIILFFLRSILLKITPEFGSAGLIVMDTAKPLCRPTPLKVRFLLIVF